MKTKTFYVSNEITRAQCVQYVIVINYFYYASRKKKKNDFFANKPRAGSHDNYILIRYILIFFFRALSDFSLSFFARLREL